MDLVVAEIGNTAIRRLGECETNAKVAIWLDGSTARMGIDGTTDLEVFRAYAHSVLCPELRAGDLVIMDNLSPHKNELTLSLIAQACRSRAGGLAFGEFPQTPKPTAVQEAF